MVNQDPLDSNEVQLPLPEASKAAEENPDEEKVPEGYTAEELDEAKEDPEYTEDDLEDMDLDDLEELNKNEANDYLNEDKDTDF